MDDATREEWLNKDRWSEGQFGELCCGMTPGWSRPRERQADLQEAEDAIKQAASNQTISHIFSPNASAADRAYGSARFYLPADVIKWAAANFPKFPFGETDLSRAVKDMTGARAIPDYKPSIEARRADWFGFPDWSEHQALCLVVDLDPGTMDYLNSGAWDGVPGFDVEKAKSQFMQQYAARTRPCLQAIKQKIGQKAYQEKYADKTLPVSVWRNLFNQVGIQNPGTNSALSTAELWGQYLREEEQSKSLGALTRAAKRAGVSRQRFRELVPYCPTHPAKNGKAPSGDKK